MFVIYSGNKAIGTKFSTIVPGDIYKIRTYIQEFYVQAVFIYSHIERKQREIQQ